MWKISLFFYFFVLKILVTGEYTNKIENIEHARDSAQLTRIKWEHWDYDDGSSMSFINSFGLLKRLSLISVIFNVFVSRAVDVWESKINIPQANRAFTITIKLSKENTKTMRKNRLNFNDAKITEKIIIKHRKTSDMNSASNEMPGNELTVQKRAHKKRFFSFSIKYTNTNLNIGNWSQFSFFFI